jgi:hypothetical protein
MRRGRLWALAVAGTIVAACGGGGGGDDDAGEATTTTRLVYRATIAGDHEVDGNYRQGLARVDGGWVFSTNNSLFRTDDAFAQVAKADPVIPPDLAAQGFDHVGDIDVAAGLLWVPLERPERDGRQAIAWYDPDTLAYVGSQAVEQHHAAFVAAEDDVLYSMDEFDGDDTILRYRWTGEELEPIDPLRMDRTIERTQGGDVADGALWLSTDDDRNGAYRIDLETGEVSDLGSAGRVEGEGEGIDATGAPDGPLRVLVADPEIIPMWVVDMAVTATPA